MCHHYDTSEIAEWERLLDAESDEEPVEDEAEPTEDADPVTPPADD